MPYPIWSHLAFTIIGGDVGGHEILVLVRPVRDILRARQSHHTKEGFTSNQLASENFCVVC